MLRDDDDDDTAEKASTDNLPLPEMRIRRRPSEYIILMDDMVEKKDQMIQDSRSIREREYRGQVSERMVVWVVSNRKVLSKAETLARPENPFTATSYVH